MAPINRRSAIAIALGAASSAAGTHDAAAQGALPRPRPRKVRPPHIEVAAPIARINPILFWNDTCIQLDALDHSLPASEARAPGPCAAALAFGLIHTVMADAVAAAYPVDFEGFLVRGVKVSQLQFPEVFVGAAAARAMEHVYNTPAHRHLISVQRERFLKHFGPKAISDWNAGLSFARADTISAQWDGNEVRNSIVHSWSLYQALPGQHVVDPYNPDQRYYGVTWGQRMPLVPQLRQFAVGPGDPPHNHDPEFLRDAEEVRVLGAWRPEGPTAEQLKIGLFWAYCGVRLIGTPARLYNQVIRQIIEHDGMSVPEMARALALCNVALADAGIVAWEGKYRYRVWRPVVALPRWHYNPAPGWRPFGSPRTNPVEFLLGSDTQFYLTALSFLGGGSERVVAQSARDVLSYSKATFTPNFPSYPSGHATFGSACFNMLKRVRAEREPTRANPGALDGMPEFVSDEVNGLSIDNFRNVPRPYLPITYRHIDQMIEDNNRSRIHLGVHWDFDCKRGDKSGALIADVIYNHIYRRSAVYTC